MTGRAIPVALLAAALLALPAQAVDRPPIRLEAISLTGATLVLTNRAGVDTSPAVSPATGEIAFASDRGGGFDLYVMSAYGTSARRLTTGPFPVPSESDPSEVATNDAGTTLIAWSPDGKQLAFDTQNATFPPTCQHNCVDWRTFVVNADGTGPRLVADAARAPSWAPSGRKLAVQGEVTPYGESVSVQIVSLAGGSDQLFRRFNPDPRHGVVWSSRGTIAFQANLTQDGPLSVFTAVPGRPAVRLAGIGSQPAWSPDGRQLAYVRGERLVVVDSTARRTLSPAGESVSFPVWSPDGRRIAFLALRPKGAHQLAVVTVATHAERLLTHLPPGSFFDTGPVWSRDGARLIVAVSRAS